MKKENQVKSMGQDAKDCEWESGGSFSSISTTSLRTDLESHLVFLRRSVFMVTMRMMITRYLHGDNDHDSGEASVSSW